MRAYNVYRLRSATTALTITSPSPNSNASGTITVRGTAGSAWVDIAAFYGDTKIAADVTPVNGAFTLQVNTTLLPSGSATFAVIAFSVGPGQSGGTSKQVNLTLTVSNSTATGVPAPAAAVGYNTRTYGPALKIGPATLTSAAGANLYADTYYSAPGSSKATANSDGSITFMGGGNGFNAHFGSTAFGPSPAGWVGKAFGGGGYFEATLSWSGPYERLDGWPSFWSNDLEHMSGLYAAASDPGIEPDFMEFWSATNYGGALHDWYGGSGGPDVVTGVSIDLPGGTNVSTPHRYGPFLWVPATTNTKGRCEWYFDRTLRGSATWDLYNPGRSLPPVQGSTAGGLIDLGVYPCCSGLLQPCR